jgi:hypothetical protein
MKYAVAMASGGMVQQVSWRLVKAFKCCYEGDTRVERDTDTRSKVKYEAYCYF